jgi:hypothetical protein
LLSVVERYKTCWTGASALFLSWNREAPKDMAEVAEEVKFCTQTPLHAHLPLPRTVLYTTPTGAKLTLAI